MFALSFFKCVLLSTKVLSFPPWDDTERNGVIESEACANGLEMEGERERHLMVRKFQIQQSEW